MKYNTEQITSKIIKDIEQGQYQVKRIEEELNLSRKERLRRRMEEIERSREETYERKMLLLFRLGKELRDDYTRGGKKKDKTIA